MLNTQSLEKETKYQTYKRLMDAWFESETPVADYMGYWFAFQLGFCTESECLRLVDINLPKEENATKCL